MKKTTFFFFITVVAALFTACSDYQKVLKGDDNQKKYDMALELYKDGKYNRAFPLFDQLNIVYRGTEKGERIAYYQAMCNFGVKDYILAEHRLTQYYKNYPSSPFAQGAQFNAAICAYKMSPTYSLDQGETKKALRSFQRFTLDYPESNKIDTVNGLMDELRGKLEYKDYKAARLYFDMESYRAATTAIEHFINEYPNSEYREEMTYAYLKSAYELATNSVQDKKLERIEQAMEAYTTFASRFPESKKIDEADDLHQDLLKQLETAKN